MTDTPTIQVAHFRQVLLWPLRLMHRGSDDAHARPWEVLQAMGNTCPWHAVDDEYTGSAEQFHERYCNEFVTFLPYVQQFLYGDGRAAQGHGQIQAAVRLSRWLVGRATQRLAEMQVPGAGLA